MTFRTKWETYKDSIWPTNIQSVLSGNFDHNKMLSRCDEMDIPVETYMEALADGNIFAARLLAKDPTRQNLQETFQAQYVNNLVGYEAIQLLPKKNKFTFKQSGYQTKTTDGLLEMPDGEKFFLGMKLITGSGGAQNSQRKDIQKYLAIGANTAQKRILALIDDTHAESSEFYLNPVKDRNKAFIFNSDSLVQHIKYHQN